ncbi:DUF2975 domain-containing protein [Bradyrhizobium sp. WD16]|uniref:DUF2975 domain-containing protein n=1 Tax=Bradyrhizobium sp. WD16 TaxID=1521768 RepID=UPI0020A39A9C|nr:DUF2975 domain-containing protein [Bradyrhizobium sp. WD16]UTD29159.1 DUF2975 domain-containing protein [Bradyrhizobium sp. WD16]
MTEVLTATASSGRLRRFSRAMAAVTTVGTVLIAIAMVLVFFIPDWTRTFLIARVGQPGAGLPLTPGRLIAGAAVTAVPIGVMLYGLWQARALFRDFAEGRVFTRDSARRLHLFAGAVLAQAVLGPASSTGLLLAFTLSNPPGQRLLGITLSVNDYVALIVGGVLLAISWVMVEAARIADEHARFV